MGSCGGLECKAERDRDDHDCSIYVLRLRVVRARAAVYWIMRKLLSRLKTSQPLTPSVIKRARVVKDPIANLL